MEMDWMERRDLELLLQEADDELDRLHDERLRENGLETEADALVGVPPLPFTLRGRLRKMLKRVEEG